MKRSLVAASLFVLSLLVSAVVAAVAPMKVTPLGKADAPEGGTFQYHLNSEPESLNPINVTDLVSQEVAGNVVEGLLYTNPDTWQNEPQLAKSYEVSKDGLTFTFKLDERAHFSDGHPVTSDDVRFSVECVRDPAYQAAHRIPYYEDVKSIETPDPQTVIFKMKKKYFLNLQVLGSTGIVPKHIYGDPKKKFSGAPLFGSGAYKVETYNRGRNIILVRDKNWWGAALSNMKATSKFERINFRFIKEENLAVEMVKKGELDYMEDVRDETFVKKAEGEPFGTKIKKIEAENKRSKPWGFIGWNFKNPIFAERDNRVALAHLFNRPMLMEKYFYGKVVEGRGPVYYSSPFMPSDVKPIEFSPEKAKVLLKKAGWKDEDHNGVLEKVINGEKREFRFTLLLPNPDVQKYFTLYKEDLKKGGIDMEIKIIEWNAFVKLLDEQKFDAVTMRWGGGSPEEDLKQIWHSDSARAGGSNFISYKNPGVDKLIDQAREELNRDKRKGLWQKAVRLIANDAPYAFMFNPKYDHYFLNGRVGFEKPSYTYDIGSTYWYMLK